MPQARGIVDVEALRALREAFGPVASDNTARCALAETGGRARTAIGRSAPRARAHVWTLLPDGLPEATFAGGMAQPGMVVREVDGPLVVAHSKKERAADQEDVWPSPAGVLDRQHRGTGPFVC
ncbi:MAG TPA: hypothetical protein VFC00_09950 [Micromonosporaceae bacterium]|nr:hypothetical protein [Micromonosporaceae bacterium]